MKKSIGLLSFVLFSGVLYGAPAYETEGMAQVKNEEKKGGEFARLPVNWKASPEDLKKAKQAWEIIDAWQKDGVKDTRKMHVVYVTLPNRPALKGYRERLDRIVKNIQAYYSDQMKENGFPPLTFSLDLDKEGKVVVHDAYLDVPMETLDTPTSGPPTRKAAEEVLRKAGIDPEREYVLIVVQMPDKKGPYYGSGNFENGRCWICDAEHLDTLNFKSKEPGPYRFGTLGMDNTVYIGGTAHELGHCFSLPHTTNLTPDTETGASLMGNGNYHYGKELRGEGKGSFLIQSDALRLASIPLFSGRHREIPGAPSVEYSVLSAKSADQGLELSGKVTGTPPVYGLVAYFDPIGGSDYDASTTTCVPDRDGNFRMDVRRPGYKGVFELRLVALHANGATSSLNQMMVSDGKGVDVSPIVSVNPLREVKKAWLDRDWKGASEALKKVRDVHGKEAAFQPILALWEKAVSPRQKFDQGDTPAQIEASSSRISLADVKPDRVSAGWWTPFWDTLPPNDVGPAPFFKTGVPSRFLYTHAWGEFVYDLGGKWKTFEAVLGIPSCAYGKIVFRVKGDGKELFASPILREGDSVPVKLDVAGVRTLTIEVDKAEKSNASCWGVIGDPVLLR